MTSELIYLRDANIGAADTIVEEVGPAESGICWITLAETPFFPEGGGQSGDVGFIRADAGVLKVEKTVLIAGRARHIGNVDGHLSAGEACHAAVDWPVRAQNTRLHSAGELICAAIAKILPASLVTKANHRAGQSSITIDMAMPESMRAGFVSAIEQDVARMIKAALPIRVFTVDTPQHARDYCGFLPVGLDDVPIRIVQIGDIFARPCCGTHAQVTSELGRIEIRSLKVRRGETRIGYDVGGTDCG